MSKVERVTEQKKVFSEYLRNLSAAEKIKHLIALQNHYYELLEIRVKNGGLPMPEKWQKWSDAQR